MTRLHELLDSTLATELAFSLLHTLWQALAISLVLFFALKCIPAAQSRWRYRLSLLSMVAIVLSWVGTFSILRHGSSSSVAPPSPKSHTTQPAIQTEAAQQRPAPVQMTKFSTGVQTIPSTPTANPETKGPGYGWLIPAWFIGVLFMTARIFIAMAGASRHKHNAIPIDDADLATLLKNLCERMGVKRSVQFAATRTLNHPGVIGFWKPMLLIPASMLTGTPLSDLEAIIAHELAHIRRHDYLINIGQMIVESIFFFNPAVWWISRQIRIEREACCDLMGIDATGRRADYAKVLVDEFARTASLQPSKQPAIAMGFGNDNESSTERIRRIVAPRQKPGMKIGSVRLTLLIGIAALAIAALSKTADLTVEVAAKILTPRERVEKLIELGREAETEQTINHHVYSHPEVTVSGIVKTKDGAPLPKHTRINTLSYNSDGQTSGYHGMRVDDQGRFKEAVSHMGTIILCAYANGYAPAFSKPIPTQRNGSIEHIELTLDEGFPFVLKITDAEGNPIPEAKVSASYSYRIRNLNQNLRQRSAESSTNGEARFEHTTEHHMQINIEADGFQPIDHWTCMARKGEPLSIVMKKGLVSTGVVVDQTTGMPIPNAKFRLMFRHKPRHGWSYGDQGREAGQADAEGRFIFNEFSPDTTYTYIVEADGYNSVRLENVDSKTMPHRIEMGPELYIRGTVVGDLSKLGSVYTHPTHDGFLKGFHYTGHMLKDGRLDYSDRENGAVEVKVKDNIGYFELSNILGDHITLRSSDSITRAVILLNGESVEDIVIDLDSNLIVRNTPHREVAFIFNTPPGLPPAEGMIQVWHATAKKRETGDSSWSGMDIRVTNGVGRATFDAPCYIRLGSASELKGYWTEPEDEKKANQRLVEAGGKPFELSYTLTPAGGISGTILDDMGRPLNNMDLDIHPVFPEKSLDFMSLTPEERSLLAEEFHKQNELRNILGNPRIQSKNGTFAFTSLPLGHTYRISALSRHTLLASPPVTLTEEHPIQNIVLKHEPLQKVSGKVVMPDGAPGTNMPVKLRLRIMRHSYSQGDIHTDDTGYFEFTELNPDPDVEHHLSIDTGTDWQPIKTKVKPGSHQTYTVAKGLHLKGKVIDHETGLPLEGITVSTANLDKLKDWDMQEIYVETDPEGLFSFSTLAPGEYAIGAINMETTSPSSTNRPYMTFTAGEEDFIELKVKPMTNFPTVLP